MSYCRFFDSDVYMFGTECGIECMSCKLAPMVKTIFTSGLNDDPLFGNIEQCKRCGGEGCDSCMMHGSLTLPDASAALEHLRAHRAAGHDVPERAMEMLREEIASAGAVPIGVSAQL